MRRALHVVVRWPRLRSEYRCSRVGVRPDIDFQERRRKLRTGVL